MIWTSNDVVTALYNVVPGSLHSHLTSLDLQLNHFTCLQIQQLPAAMATSRHVMLMVVATLVVLFVGNVPSLVTRSSDVYISDVLRKLEIYVHCIMK